MPEAGYLPIPRKLLRAWPFKRQYGADSVRMSGTAFAIVLHITPESAVGGPLALVKTGT